jgi:putative peptidoglycan lipid II flippase
MVLKNIFHRQTNSIAVAAVMVGVSSLLSRFLGIFRDRILAGEFGAGQTLDIYYSAFRIPDLIFNMLVLGALSAGFIPIFTGLIKDFKVEHNFGLFKFLNKDAWDLVNNILNVLLIFLVGLSVLGVIFAPQLVRLISPGFTPEAQVMTTTLVRIMFLSPIFLGISGVLGGVLQSFKSFFIYSLAPILYNIGIIIGALYFVPRWGVVGLAWGVVLGAAMHMLIQIPAVKKLGFDYRLFINFRDRNLRKIGQMMIPRTLSLAISQVDLLVTTIIASSLVTGSLAIFSFSNNLQSFPISIFGISFAVAAFPVLAAAAASDDKKKLGESFSQTVRQILFFIIPSTVLLIALRAQIIRVILGTGAFSWRDTVLTIDTLGFLSLSLFAQAIIPLITRVFYAKHDSRTPFFIGIFVVATNIFLSLWLGKKMGVAGLGLAFSLSNILNFILLWIFMSLKVESLDQPRILVAAGKFAAAAVVCGLVVQSMKDIVWPFIDMSKFTGVLMQGATAGLCGFISYLLVCWLLKSEELFSFVNVIKRRLPWKKVKIEDQGEVRGI